MKLRSAFLATAIMVVTATAPLAAQTAATAAAAPAAAAPAAAAPAKVNVTAGAPVLDAAGGAVGTVASVTADAAIVDTGTVKVGIPVASFAQSDKGLHISMTKAELEAAAKGAQAGATQDVLASLTPGTAVSDQNGGAVGKVDSVEGNFVVVATPTTKVKLPATAFAKGPNGAVIGMTLAQLEAAAKGAAPTGG